MVRSSAEKIEHTGPAEKERVASVPQREQLASTPELPLPKGKRNRAICPKLQIVRWERVKVSESRTLARGREIRVRAWRGKGGLYSEGRQIPLRKGRAGKESLSREGGGSTSV